MHNPISWHIEPTSRCTLECPGCDRTWYQKTFKHQIIQDIDIHAVINFFAVNNFYKSTIRLCGNNGDPIYHPKFIEFISLLKTQQHSIVIHTNGSAKTQTFWNDLCKLLTDDDQIIFAIDGLEDTNHQYRKNSNWQQVMEAVTVATASNVQTEWQFIVFRYNQHQVDQAKQMSKDLNMDSFQIIKSHRWMDESLQKFMPDEEFIDTRYHHQLDTLQDDTSTEMSPKCATNQDIYIDSKGDIYPCCWSGTHRFKQKYAFGKSRINVNQGQYVLTPTHNNFLEDTNKWDTAPLVCRLHCSK